MFLGNTGQATCRLDKPWSSRIEPCAMSEARKHPGRCTRLIPRDSGVLRNPYARFWEVSLVLGCTLRSSVSLSSANIWSRAPLASFSLASDFCFGLSFTGLSCLSWLGEGCVQFRQATFESCPCQHLVNSHEFFFLPFHTFSSLPITIHLSPADSFAADGNLFAQWEKWRRWTPSIMASRRTQKCMITWERSPERLKRVDCRIPTMSNFSAL